MGKPGVRNASKGAFGKGSHGPTALLPRRPRQVWLHEPTPGARHGSRDPGPGSARLPPPSQEGGPDTGLPRNPPARQFVGKRGRGDRRPPPSPSGAPGSRRRRSTSGAASTSAARAPSRRRRARCCLSWPLTRLPLGGPRAQSPGKQPRNRKTGDLASEGLGWRRGWTERAKHGCFYGVPSVKSGPRLGTSQDPCILWTQSLNPGKDLALF